MLTCLTIYYVFSLIVLCFFEDSDNLISIITQGLFASITICAMYLLDSFQHMVNFVKGGKSSLMQLASIIRSGSLISLGLYNRRARKHLINSSRRTLSSMHMTPKPNVRPKRRKVHNWVLRISWKWPTNLMMKQVNKAEGITERCPYLVFQVRISGSTDTKTITL